MYDESRVVGSYVISTADGRACWEGILWILKTGARWRAFLCELDHEDIFKWDEVFVDATFIPAKKGERRSGKPGEASTKTSSH